MSQLTWNMKMILERVEDEMLREMLDTEECDFESMCVFQEFCVEFVDQYVSNMNYTDIQEVICEYGIGRAIKLVSDEFGNDQFEGDNIEAVLGFNVIHQNMNYDRLLERYNNSEKEEEED
jgi:hypothetical protein